MFPNVFLILLFLLCADAKHAPKVLSHYAPQKHSACPAHSLVRAAKGISPAEASYIQARNVKASAALSAWVKKVDPGFGADKMPVVALANSGGGFRALLTGAGVIKSFDGREGSDGTNGLYQGLSYHSGLSGGSWLLSSLMANDWPTITSLQDTLWVSKFKRGLIFQGLNPRIQWDLASKRMEGEQSSLVNLWGRALSYMLLKGKHGGVDSTLSSIADSSSFQNHAVPYPIITAVQIDTAAGSCGAVESSTQFELHPYEFGSWDPGIRGFTPMRFLGTPANNGKPANKKGKCTTGFDNIGYIFGTSSSLFNMVCSKAASQVGVKLAPWLQRLVGKFYKKSPHDVYAAYPNPFRGYLPAAKVSKQKDINLVDGGQSHQNIPIWPFIQPERQVNVLIVSDNSGEVNKFPIGKSLFHTYQASKAAGLTKMPVIPSETEIQLKGLNKGPKFFGCKGKDTMTIIWLPNSKYSFASNQPTMKLKYSAPETKGMSSILHAL